MPSYENKTCGRCNSTFECKADNIAQCQCNAIQLSPEERIYIASKYVGCLCVNCLLSIKEEFLKEKQAT
jgi:hypothetical protein